MDDVSAAVLATKIDALTELCKREFQQLEDKFADHRKQLAKHADEIAELKEFRARTEGRFEAEDKEEQQRDWSKLIAAVAAFTAGAGGGILGSGNLPH